MEKINLKYNIESLKRNAVSFDISYDTEDDTLYMRLKNPPPAVSVDCGGLFWLRVNPDNGDVVGVEIEGYRKSFVRKCKALQHTKPDASRLFVDTISRELVGCLR